MSAFSAAPLRELIMRVFIRFVETTEQLLFI